MKIFFVRSRDLYPQHENAATYGYQYSYENTKEELQEAYRHFEEVSDHIKLKLSDMFASIRFSTHSNHYFSFDDEADHAHFTLWSNDLEWDIEFICPN